MTEREMIMAILNRLNSNPLESNNSIEFEPTHSYGNISIDFDENGNVISIDCE